MPPGLAAVPAPLGSAFDSDHVGARVAHLALAGVDAATADAALDALASAPFDLVVVRIHEDDEARAVLEARRHLPADILVTSEWSGTEPPTSVAASGLSFLVGEGLAQEPARELGAFFARQLRRSHWHADPRIAPAAATALFAAWGENDARGRAARVWQVRAKGVLVGALAAIVRGPIAAVDLVAVAEELRGQGVGAHLLHEFVAWALGLGLRPQIGTQADNPALRLYQRQGFVPVATHRTYHLWR